eukprot:scaffold74720_cov33-Attheya_sp.AAC.3
MGGKTLAIIRKPRSIHSIRARNSVAALVAKSGNEWQCGGRDAGAIASRGRVRTIAAAARGSSSGQG